jgi:glucose/arabinose dehydrogenase
MDFDPLSGNLWATEAGLYYVDELNLVKPGFNSGWSKIQGMGSRCTPVICGYLKNNSSASDNTEPSQSAPPPPTSSPSSTTTSSSSSSYQIGLVDFGEKGKYSDPQFVWEYNPTPTAVKFFNSDKLGKQYENDLFVGDFNWGNLYHFKLNESRTGLLLDGPLADKVANAPNETKSIIFGQGFGGATALYIKKHKDFGGITDIEVGPDGYLYILTFRQTQGTIYRIVSK